MTSDAPFRADWANEPSVEDMTRELIERRDEMSGTEFSVKTNRLRQAGGYWPNSLAGWTTDEGRALSEKLRQARAAKRPAGWTGSRS